MCSTQLTFGTSSIELHFNAGSLIHGSPESKMALKVRSK